ncbi:stage II sporulation protein M [Alkalibacillus aidingensis]|uniref:stage II sporulation protein M n=1 Tax=Alkalibacillus aidingensis TaxID=2747607 RepID=UPI00166018ED|nr:stage II sporulation protein M [Alkalibacillus aidingensis]
MKRWVRAFTVQIQPYYSLYVFLFVLFVIGVIFGSMMVSSLNFIQQQDLYFFVEQYFFTMTEQPAGNFISLFWDALWTHGKYITFLFLFGLSFVGLPVVWFLLFIKGVVIGFTVGFLVNQLSWQGFFLSVMSIAPQNLLIVPAYLIIAASSMIFTIHVMRILFIKHQSSHTIADASALYIKSYIVALGLIAFGSVLETFISTNMLQIIVGNL